MGIMVRITTKSRIPFPKEENGRLNEIQTGKHATTRLDIPSLTMGRMDTSRGPMIRPRVSLSLTTSSIWATQGRRSGYGM